MEKVVSFLGNKFKMGNQAEESGGYFTNQKLREDSRSSLAAGGWRSKGGKASGSFENILEGFSKVKPA